MVTRLTSRPEFFDENQVRNQQIASELDAKVQAQTEEAWASFDPNLRNLGSLTLWDTKLEIIHFNKHTPPNHIDLPIEGYELGNRANGEKPVPEEFVELYLDN